MQREDDTTHHASCFRCRWMLDIIDVMIMLLQNPPALLFFHLFVALDQGTSIPLLSGQVKHQL